jgi:transcriptional regulator with XRE-family HTH domain
MPRSLAGTRIRQRRKNLGLTQTALAKETGISTSYLNLIEHNKRRIAGRTLNAIARSLEIDVGELEEGAQNPLFEKLQWAASRVPASKVELDQMAEFVGRFPGWAQLLAGLATGLELNQGVLNRLSDRLAYDPFLSDSMHAMLSNVTAIRSTASILAQRGDVPAELQQRFHKNLHSESLRLSDTAQALVDYFDDANQAADDSDTDKLGLAGFLSAHGHYLAEIEVAPDGEEPIEIVEKMAGGQNYFSHKSGREKVRDFLGTYRQDARAMPMDAFLKVCREIGFSPIGLSHRLDQSLQSVFRRLSSLPQRDGIPGFGYISCDTSGSILHRKEIPGLSLPKYGGGCPIWPLYQSLTAGGQPLVQIIETPARERFWASAVSYGIGKFAYGRPQTRHAAMVFLPENLAPTYRLPVPQAPVTLVGPTCRLCANPDCDARRGPSML